MASGMPSRRRQSWATDRAFCSVRTNVGWTALARSTNSRQASTAPTSRAATVEPTSGVVREAIGRIASPGTPRASRLVTTTRTAEHDRTSASASSAHSARTGSQSSSTSRSRLPFRWSTMAARSDRPAGSVRPMVLTTDGSTKAGSVRVPHSTIQAPSSNRSRSGLASRRPTRVLPTPPGPVRVRSDDCSRIRVACSISRSRPMKLVTSSLRLFLGASVVRGGGKSRARPGPVTW